MKSRAVSLREAFGLEEPRDAQVRRDRNPFRLLANAVMRELYRIYERRLHQEVRSKPIPFHIGIILDGNRRHTEQCGVRDPQAMYMLGAGKLDDLLAWCGELPVGAVTLWVFSTENWGRPLDQVSGIFAAVEAKVRSLEAKVRSLIDHPTIHARQVRVRAIGKLELLPSSLHAALRDASAATANYHGMTLTIAVAYGGRHEIVDAVRGLLAECARRGLSIAEAIPEMSCDGIARHLYTAGSPDPDLIIRTSGEVRLSGFLLWQSVHTEFYFCDVPWPTFRKIDFLRAVRSYQQRKRRFGR